MNIILFGLVICSIAACAVATGSNSTATVGTKSEIKRELAASAPTIEEVIIDRK
jgi:hypothetical protein